MKDLTPAFTGMTAPQGCTVTTADTGEGIGQ